MTLQPGSLDDLSNALADANALGEKVSRILLGALNRVVAHAPDDLTVTVEAGITLAQLQTELARRRQWLPIDPPNPERLTLGALLATNASGPRRFGYGTIRDYLIGIQVALADGRVIKSGGKVVKNVAGYDLAKLFIGSHGSLGVIVEATFKLRPLPELERFVQVRCESLEQAGTLLESVLESELAPVVLDLHNIEVSASRRTGESAQLPGSPAPPRGESTPLPAPCSPLGTLVVGFAGTREEVEWQLAKAHELGLTEAATLDYEKSFWSGEPTPRRISVLPSRVVETVRGLGGVAFVARAGSGVIDCRGGPLPTGNELPIKLMRRVKDEFDPKDILPDLPL